MPTTDLVLTHIHPDDRDAAFASREANIAHREPFTFQHRIIDAHRRVRTVIAAGHVEEDATGLIVTGHVIDLTEFGDRRSTPSSTKQLRTSRPIDRSSSKPKVY